MTRAALAALVREYLLAGHLIDRAGMPHVVAEFGIDGMREVAIEEWMAASPVYTRRMRQVLGFDGDDVATIFKGMQFDIGAPHQFMDFRYAVTDATHGEFWLASCGALLDVEPLGDEFVVTMCHHIEDPTFDATAAATNPRARVRPLHRPPRVPAGRHPHCHWTVDVVADAAPLDVPAVASALGTSRAAGIDPPVAPDDYAGAFDPDLDLERFGEATLQCLLDELALQGHLLARAFMVAVATRWGPETAARLGRQQLTGIAGLTARRLARHLGVSGGGPPGIAAVLDVHPALRPRTYVASEVTRRDGAVEVSIGPCQALTEVDGLSWPALLVGGHDDAMAAMATAVDPQARCRRSGDTWTITVDPDGPPAAEPKEVLLTSFSTGADFRFRH